MYILKFFYKYIIKLLILYSLFIQNWISGHILKSVESVSYTLIIFQRTYINFNRYLPIKMYTTPFIF